MATISYTQTKIDVFKHADFVNRWFNWTINLNKENCHSNCIESKDGEKFIFRNARFSGFKNIVENSLLCIVEEEKSKDMYILKPKWITTLGWLTNRSSFNVRIHIKTYRNLLNFMSLMQCRGQIVKSLTDSHKLIKIQEYGTATKRVYKQIN